MFKRVFARSGIFTGLVAGFTVIGAIGASTAALAGCGRPTPTLTTAVLDANGNNVTGEGVPLIATQDTSALSGLSSRTPTGTVTYLLFKNGTCSGSPLSWQIVNLNSDGTVPASTLQVLPTAADTAYSYLAAYSGDWNYNRTYAACEPFIRNCADSYWKAHVTTAAALIAANQPFYIGDEALAGSTTNIAHDVHAIYANSHTTCRTQTDAGILGCLALRLLTAQLNVLNGGPNVIDPTVATAQQFLGMGGTVSTVTYAGKTTAGIVYTGPTGTYTINYHQATIIRALNTELFNYNDTGIA